LKCKRVYQTLLNCSYGPQFGTASTISVKAGARRPSPSIRHECGTSSHALHPALTTSLLGRIQNLNFFESDMLP
jgi:hypothetical protein